jgi:hypothetical protein
MTTDYGLLPPKDRITAIRKSLTAFVCGIIGFLPFIGVVPAVYTLVCWVRIPYQYGKWNPAAAYLRCGVWLALLGLLGSALIVAVALVMSAF